jgi:MFS family permease
MTSYTPRFSKADIRQSLQASTLDGAFASIFDNIVKGVLISNFLLDLGAGAFEIGLLASVPMLAHFLQPLGAYLSEKTTSRHAYCLWIYSVARLLWLLPAVGILLLTNHRLTEVSLIWLTMGVLTVSNILEAVGCASWMSWMAVLVPEKLRGRYFGLRRSLSSFIALLTLPAGGWLVSQWKGGEVEGYALALIFAVLMGLVSLGFQFYMMDVNPQTLMAIGRPRTNTQASIPAIVQTDTQASIQTDTQASIQTGIQTDTQTSVQTSIQTDTQTDIQTSDEFKRPEPVSNQKPATDASASFWQDRNFLTLLVFLGLWAFSVNLSAPFFNYYLLDSLQLDVQWVTLYSSLQCGAFFLTIMRWGHLADRIGNRPVIVGTALLAALAPLIWSYTDGSLWSLWLLLPLVHLLQGTSFAALDLCLANIQIELAPVTRQSAYFAAASAVMGLSGALGTTLGSFLAELSWLALPTLFALTAVVRLGSIIPIGFVQENRAQSIRLLLERQWQRLALSVQPARIKI